MDIHIWTASLPALQPARCPAYLPTVLPSVLPADWSACLPAHWQTCQQAGLNIMEKQYGTKDGNRAIDFHQQNGQLIYNNEKKSDFLYFSEE